MKKVCFFSAVVLLSIAGLVATFSYDAYHLQEVVTEARSRYSWLDDHIQVIEKLHLNKRPELIDTVKLNFDDYSEKYTWLKKYQADVDDWYENKAISIWQTIRTYLQQLKSEYSYIPDFILNYPANRWINTESLFDHIAIQSIPGRLINRMYGILVKPDSFSIYELRKHMANRNILVNDVCTNINNIPGQKKTFELCAYSRERVMLETWQKWFLNSLFSSQYHPYFRGNAASLATKQVSKIKICNMAPYKVQTVIYSKISPYYIHPKKSLKAGLNSWVDTPTQGDWGVTSGWYSLDAGSCSDKYITFYDKQPEFYVHTSTPDFSTARWVNERVNELILSDGNLGNDWAAVKLTSHGEQSLMAVDRACVSTAAIKVSEQTGANPVCSDGQILAGFAQAVKMDEGSDTYFFGVQAPNLYLLPAWNKVDQGMIDQALSRAKNLAITVQVQMKFDREWAHRRELPFGLGAELLDFNGPLQPGVGVQRLTQYTSIFGVERNLRKNDVILGINNHPVFGERDLLMHLFEHASSISAGIEKPIFFKIYRDGKTLIEPVPESYYFSTRYEYAEYDPSVLAFMYGLGDVPALGRSPEVWCYGKNIIKGVTNIAYGGLKTGCRLLSTLGMSLNCPVDDGIVFAYGDSKTCIFRHQQSRAYARQYKEKIYENVQWLGFVSPGSIRLIFKKVLKRKIKRRVGSAALAARLTGGLLEAVESSIWSWNTEPPGTPNVIRFNDAGHIAGIGFVSGFVLSGR